MKKLAVMAGTPVDTYMGSLLAQSLPLEIIEAPISKNPVQQTFFQTLPYQKRLSMIETIIEELLQQNIDGILVYCNSLSGSIDFDELAKKYQVFILTPFQVYRGLAQDFQRLGVLSANSQGAAGIERELVQHHEKIQVYSVTNLDWVNGVEAKLPPNEIVKNFGLIETIGFFEKNQVESILIGCTHFPYFLAEYQAKTSIPCINPDDLLLEKLLHFLAK